eukprot:6200365-Pleurochrysis_carterae.AAC.2
MCKAELANNLAVPMPHPILTLHEPLSPTPMREPEGMRRANSCAAARVNTSEPECDCVRIYLLRIRECACTSCRPCACGSEIARVQRA